MSERMGPITYQEEEETVFLGREITRRRDHSEAVSVMIDEEIKSLVMTEYQRAKELIQGNQDKIRRLYEALLKYETLRGSDLDKLMAGEPLPEPKPPDAGPAAASQPPD
jgi:cell division protease FtsH